MLADKRLTVVAQEALDVINAQHFTGAIAGQLLGEGTEVSDGVIGAENDDQTGSGFDERAESSLATFLSQGQAVSFGDAGQAGAEGIGIDGLEDVVGGALTQGGDGALQIGVASDDEDRGIGSQLPQPRQQLFGVAIRQATVEQDGGDARPIFPSQDFRRRTGGFDTVVIQFEDVAQIAPRIGVIIDHQHEEIRVRLHAPPPPGGGASGQALLE